ncbi:hypothetical protein CONCODRAFT_83265 [Conidiobolus coronatus NRRL 28638]|uniref:SRR1-like domain-containing protein n=1 Tax=Conidiobolus coronatus (strain ATCC 28846 / CBS 209.66 / NRRL 28638) TaxID=796925 RepID=A0A137PFW8_CONC2|nr:hypothetical protein CONCODRAFT_83265 [Conidiobolus coronatus NRRL 28638]|eukprot:KXN73889.1 hypothetical protein CONCODRAFT_83265 [Conidiobolus coronatus NRRL 28638]
MEADGFTVVKKSKKSKKFSNFSNKSLKVKLEEKTDNIDFKFFNYSLEFLKEQIEYWEEKGYFKNGSEVDIICYGIGSPSDSINAQYQLSYIYKLRNALNVKGKFEVFDPVEQSKEDLEIYSDWGFEIIPHNEEAKRSIDNTPTIFYMPHCPKLLYNNVLGANWNLSKLDKIVVIGNRFELYDDLNLDKSLKEICPYLYNCLDLVKIDIFPPFAYDETVFNDTSFHRFQTKLNPKLLEFEFKPLLSAVISSDEEVIKSKEELEEKLDNLEIE